MTASAPHLAAPGTADLPELGTPLESVRIAPGVGRGDAVSLRVVRAGPVGGPPVILLHGFPEGWYGWRKQIAPLARAGYRVWVPDQRGYGPSDKPARVSDYHIDRLADDVLGLLEAATIEAGLPAGTPVPLVGHDWGAAVAWWVALRDPERLQRLAILNVPHPVVMDRALRTSLRQILRSWYIVFFQLPCLPEGLARAFDHAFMLGALRRSGRPDTFSDEDLDHYRAAWGEPGALTAMLAWYRSAARSRPRAPRPRVGVKTLMLWGCRDTALGEELAQPSIDLCDDGRLVLVPEATHWIQHEEPERVNAELLAFLAEREGAR